MSNVIRGKRCNLNLAPTLTSDWKGHALCNYSLLFLKGHEKDKLETKKKVQYHVAEEDMKEDAPSFIDDLVSSIQSMDTTSNISLLNKLASDIFHPSNFCRISEEVISLALKRRLMTSVRAIPWNKARASYRQTKEHPAENFGEAGTCPNPGLKHRLSVDHQKDVLDHWDYDFRFLGPWWISLRVPVPLSFPRRNTSRSPGEHAVVHFDDELGEIEPSQHCNMDAKTSLGHSSAPTLKRESITASISRRTHSIPRSRSGSECSQRLSVTEVSERKQSQSGKPLPIDRYAPHLLPEDLKDESKINNYVSRLAMRFRSGPLFSCETVHFDHIDMTPARMHVLMFDGIVLRIQQEYRMRLRQNLAQSRLANVELSWVSQKEHKFLSRTALFAFSLEDFSDCIRHLENDGLNESLSISSTSKQNPMHSNPCRITTISFSICNIGNSALMVLFAGLMATHAVPPPMENLDLSYNSLTHSSLYMLASLLPCTRIRRLSLRGNNLVCTESQSFREFLTRGCYFLEELDLSYTHLSPPQLNELMEMLRHRRALRILLLYGVNIPQHLLIGMEKLVRKAENFYLFCDQWNNAEEDEKGTLLCSPGSTYSPQTSFFAGFYKSATQQGWKPPDSDSLPSGYRPFRFNDPSLPENLYK